MFERRTGLSICAMVLLVCGHAVGSGLTEIEQPERQRGARSGEARGVGQGWNAETALPVDPTLVTGRLENGLRYIIKQHAVPPGRAVMWIHIGTGSLNETDRQRGIAHYLEHMAFNGSENFAPGSLVPFFQSLGMTFGRDQNAFTSFDQTVYQLSLPDAKPETLGDGMRFFADVVGRLSLLPEEIEEERQIIQEERRRGLSGRQRTQYEMLEKMAPGSLFGVRLPIGTEETINSVMVEDFRAYYDAWYGASNSTLMVVADADPEVVKGVIEAHFGGLPARPVPVSQDVGVRAYEKSFAIVTHDPEVRTESVQIVRLEPARRPVTTVGGMREDLVDSLGQFAMNRRLSNKVAAGGTSYMSASASSGTQSRAIHTAEISGRAKPGMWRAALEEIALELQRARAFGFSAREIEEARREIVSGAERAVETEATRPAQMIIGRLNSDVAAGRPTMSAKQRLDLINALLPTITDEEVSSRFRTEFDTSAVSFGVTLPSGPTVPTEQELLDIGVAALAVKPTPEAESEGAVALMTELPEPGKVSEGAMHEASRVWSGWLSNGVRVHFREMKERENQVTVSIDLIGGELLETAQNRGITGAATLAWSRPATMGLSSSEIRSLMTGKKVSVRGGGFGGGRGGGGGGSNTDSISLSISGSPEDLEPGFQLAHLLLTEPRIEPSAFEQFVTASRESILESETNPLRYGTRVASAAMYPADVARVQPLTVAQVDRLKLDEAQTWLDAIVRGSPIEVTIVGDIDRGRLMPLVERYIGSLPARERVGATLFSSERSLKRPVGPRVVTEVIKTPTQQAFVMSGFYGADQLDRDDARAMALASRIMSTRMVTEVREKEQLVYSIGAGSRPGTTYPGFGMFSAAAPTEPAKADALVAKLGAMYDAFAKEGPSEEELDVARKQIANTFQQDLLEPGYWSRRIGQMTFRGDSLDEILADPEAYQRIDAEAIRSTFAKYYRPENMVTVVVKPEPAEGGGAH
ncbi:MAG: insulinase family protein [Phycisphaeraceae bacterium]|nr:MAG: insulinase family protein [Phycisphaeraceae bacterium]